MKKLSLRVKMLLFLLPVLAAILVFLTYISASTSRTAIREATTTQMQQTLQANVNSVDGNLDIISNTCVNIAAMVSTSYRFVQMDGYKETLTKIINENESILGAGLWFEPNTFDPNEKYIGPYWYKDGGSVVETWDYSNAEYDYFVQA